MILLLLLAKPLWLNHFPAYPGAREVCWQHVSATTMHISWRLYASKDSSETVISYYRKNSPESEIQPTPATELWLKYDNRDLHIMPKEANHPDCGKKVQSDEKTVFVVSSATR